MGDGVGESKTGGHWEVCELMGTLGACCSGINEIYLCGYLNASLDPLPHPTPHRVSGWVHLAPCITPAPHHQAWGASRCSLKSWGVLLRMREAAGGFAFLSLHHSLAV